VSVLQRSESLNWPHPSVDNRIGRKALSPPSLAPRGSKRTTGLSYNQPGDRRDPRTGLYVTTQPTRAGTPADRPDRSGLRVHCAPRETAGGSASTGPVLEAYGDEIPVRITTSRWRVELALSGSAAWAEHPGGDIAVVVHGELHDGSGGRPLALAEAYLEHGERFVQQLRGSFALLVVDRRQDRVLAVTDLQSSRRIFWSRAGEGYLLTSDLSAQPRHSFPLDPVGLAWVLSSGAAFNRRTLYDGVRVLDRACVHELTEHGLRSREYHRYLLNDRDEPLRDEREMEEVLADALVRCVERRVSDEPDLFLALSGGHDSTAIAGILADTLGVRGVASFSYSLSGRAEEDTDAHSAARTSALLGYPHRVVRSYEGDLLQHIRWNARLGEGLTYPCDEVDAWMSMARHFRASRRPVLLTGDESLGIPDIEGLDRSRVRARARMRLLELPHRVDRFLAPDLLRDMRSGLDADYADIVSRQPPTEHSNDLFDYICFDQRGVHVYRPWRERFSDRFAAVRAPWNDPDIIEIITALPRRYRLDRRLFKQTVERRYPRLFSEPRAEVEGYQPDLGAELRRHEHALRRWIRDSNSRLDDVVPPELGVALLDAETNAAEPLRRRAARWVFRGHRRLATIPGSPVEPAARPPLRGPALFRRWAILRMALGADPS